MEVRVPMKRVHSVNEDLPYARLLEGRAAEAGCSSNQEED